MHRTLSRDHVAPDASLQGAPLVYAQAVLCARLARVLHHALADLDWPQVRFRDRSRLERVLTRLAGDIPLVWLIAGQPHDIDQKKDTPQRDVL